MPRHTTAMHSSAPYKKAARPEPYIKATKNSPSKHPEPFYSGVPRQTAIAAYQTRPRWPGSVIKNVDQSPVFCQPPVPPASVEHGVSQAPMPARPERCARQIAPPPAEDIKPPKNNKHRRIRQRLKPIKQHLGSYRS